MDTAITLFLDDQAPELARAHDELYPERVLENIPLSLMLLSPFAPPEQDPPPHASLTLDGGDDPDTLQTRVEERLSGLLPAHFDIDEAVLMGEREPDVWEVIQTLPFQR
jgi:hypothetical protein